MIINKLELWRPLDTWVVAQWFGENGDYYQKEYGVIGHNGIDLRATDGAIVRAAHDGTIVETGHDNYGGVGVVIRTDEMFNHHGIPVFFKTIYWHLKEGSITVRVGQKVATGDIIGKADNTGKSTGSHLHFGLKPVYKGEDGWTWFNLDPQNGYNGAVDPREYFLPYLAKDSKSIIQKFQDSIANLMLQLNKLLASRK